MAVSTVPLEEILADLLSALQSELSGNSLSALASALGAPQDQTQQAVAAALPLLLGALTRNAAQPGGADALASALERDHSQPLAQHAVAFGGLGGLLEAAMGGGSAAPKALDGAGILGHLLGGSQNAAVQAVAQHSGLELGMVMKLLPALAPLVMSSLGSVRKERGMQPADLSGYLQEQTKQVSGAQGGGLLGSILDPAQDGIGIDDLARAGSFLQKTGLLGKLFGG